MAMRAVAAASEDEEDDDGPAVVGGVIEEAELTAVDELRGNFPMAFGESHGQAVFPSRCTHAPQFQHIRVGT